MPTLYEHYMEEDLLFVQDELFKEARGKEPVDKKSVYKINYYLRDHLQIPKVSEVLAKRKTQEALIAFVSRFMDEHSVQLSTAGPVHMFTFGDKETETLYQLFNTSADELREMYFNMVEETFYGTISKHITGYVKNSPHKLLVGAILIEAIQKDYKDIIECCEYILAFIEYPMLYRYYYKIGVKEDVMVYTIEHLGNRYKVKKLNSIQALIKYDAAKSVSLMKPRLITGADHTYTDLIRQVRSQMNNTFRNIANKYFENYKADATHHNRENTFEDGTIVDQEGHTTNVAQVVDRTIHKFINAEVNLAFAKLSAEMSGVDKDTLVSYLNMILSAKQNRLNKFIENIITLYFSKYPTESDLSGNFLPYGLSIYRSIGTSKDELHVEIKSILQSWMDSIVHIRDTYSREATIIGYTKAVFNYIILLINNYN